MQGLCPGNALKSACERRKGAPNALARDRKGLSMEELIGRITDAVGIDEQTAQTAIGVILGFLNKEGPDDAMAQLVEAIPGADAFIASLGDGGGETGGGLAGALGGLMGGSGGGLGGLGGSGGGLGGLAGAVGGLMGGQSGGLMSAASELMSAGLDMGQIQGVTQEVVGFAREKAGDDVVSQIVAQIPGMDQFT
jgi:hypothetical protein